MSKWLSVINPNSVIEADKRGRVLKRMKGRFGLGCDGCPLDRKDSVRILGHKRIKGRAAMIWGLAPTKEDSQVGRELKGRSGEFLWEELEALGASRSDFDIQNVVRCRPVTREMGFSVDRLPTKEEIAHCSLHTEEALSLNGGAAEVHIVLGTLAAKSLLGPEFKKDTPIYWSKKLSAKVFVIDEPARVRRENTPEWRLTEWRQRLAAAVWAMKNPGRYAWLNHLAIKPIYTVADFAAMAEKIRNHGERVAVDIEDAEIDGEQRLLCISFSWRKNAASVVVLDHPDNNTLPKERKRLKEALRAFLEDKAVEKIFHYGSYDTIRLQDLLDCNVRGYTFDTTYSHYLAYTFLRSHGLATIGTIRYPHYAGYWDIVEPYWKMPGMLGNCPLDALIKYNGADAALTKRIEIDTRDVVSLPLLQIYIGAGRTLWRMERRGPCLDRQQFHLAETVIPAKAKELADKLRQIADDPDLNPNAPDQIAHLIYTKLKLPTIADLPGQDFKGKDEELYNTREATLALIADATGHPAPRYVLDYRRFSKMESTYLTGYKVSADLNGGELRTKWFLTGAVTGRLRSGGSKDGFKGVINMQNLHGSPFLKNLLVSDPEWRRILDVLPKAVKRYGPPPDPKSKEFPEWHEKYLATIDGWINDSKPLPEDVLDLDVFLSFDYSQIEIRMLAECSGDKLLIEQFNAGLDIHCAVGNTLNPEWSFEFIKKDKETRSFIKNCHFGLVYGLTEEGLYFYLKAKGIDTTPEKAAKFHRDYFAKYKGVARFIERMQAQAMDEGHVSTIFGFLRRVGSEFDEDRTTNPMNQAVNSPIQGAAHTLLLAAMAMIDRFPKKYPLLQTPIMEVHDALVFRVKLRDLQAATAEAKRLLEVEVLDYLEKLYGFRLKVPLISEGSIGFRYGVLPDYEGGDIRKALGEWLKYNAITDAKMNAEFPLPRSVN